MPPSLTGSRKLQLGLARDDGGFRLVTPHDFFAVEAQILCIGTHEAHRIGGTRQGLVATILNGLQENQADAQGIGDVRQVQAIFDACHAQQRPTVSRGAGSAEGM